MAERIENGRRYFRLTVDCVTHGPKSPAKTEYDDGGCCSSEVCLRCEIESLTALADAGGEEDWEWLPDHKPKSPDWISSANAQVAKLWGAHMDRIASQGSFFQRHGLLSE